MKSINKSLIKVLFVLFASIILISLFSGCGYKPLTHYAKKELSGNVFVKLFVDLEDPKNAVIIKDNVNKILAQKIGSKLVHDENLADTIMFLKIDSVKMKTLLYDKDGYNKLYKAVLNVSVKYTKKETKETKSFMVTGEHNFSVDSESRDAEINDAKRFEAIKKASDDALEEVLSKIAVASFK